MYFKTEYRRPRHRDPDPPEAVAAESLAPGRALSSSGQITGVPTVAARAAFTVRVSDPSGSAIRALTLDTPPVGGFVTDPDLILHYTFDEGSGSRVWDAAPAGQNHSTDVPGAHWIADGRFGGAHGPSNPTATINRFFPANQSDLDFDPRGNAFTISVWVRTADTAGFNTMLGKDRGVEPHDVQYRIWMNGSPNGIQAINGNQYGGTLATTAPVLNDGQWHLVTLVNYLEGTTWRSRLYYNNGATFTQFNTGANGRVPGLLRIGDTTRGGNAWNGQLDELRIYRRALTQGEIAALYNAPEPETFNGWLSSILTPAQLADPALAAPAGDANGNGVPNLIEFATGSEMLLPLTLELYGAPGAEMAELTLSRNSAARGVTLIVETTGDLVTWTSLATSVNGAAPTGPAALSEGPGVVRVLTITTPMNGGPTFYRARAVLTQ